MPRILSFLCLALLLAAAAYAGLEVPAPGSFLSGIGLIAGWKCNAGILTVTIDDGPAFQLAYGVSRPDTQCGNSGFSAEFNWNLLTNGQHTIRAYENGIQFDQATFTVTTLGVEYLSGQSATCNTTLDGQNVTLAWQENQQNFALVSNAPLPATGDFNGNWDITECLSGSNFCIKSAFAWRIVQNGTNVSVTAIYPNSFTGTCTTVGFDYFDNLQVSGGTLSGKEFTDTTDLACGYRSTSTFTVTLATGGQTFSGTASEFTYEECDLDYSTNKTIQGVRSTQCP